MHKMIARRQSVIVKERQKEKKKHCFLNTHKKKKKNKNTCIQSNNINIIIKNQKQSNT